MKVWLNKYKQLVLRTRWLGVVTATALLLLGLLDLIDAGRLLIFYSEDALNSLRSSAFEISIAIAIVIASGYRVFRLSQIEGLTYRASAVSWLICVILLFCGLQLFIYKVNGDIPSNCVPEPDKICFGFYSNYHPSFTQSYAMVFIIGGAVRTFVTLIAAFAEARTRLK